MGPQVNSVYKSGYRSVVCFSVVYVPSCNLFVLDNSSWRASSLIARIFILANCFVVFSINHPTSFSYSLVTVFIMLATGYPWHDMTNIYLYIHIHISFLLLFFGEGDLFWWYYLYMLRDSVFPVRMVFILMFNIFF